MPVKSPESSVASAEVRSENAESERGSPSPSEVEGSRSQRRQKEVTLMSREPTRVQTFAPEVQEEVATAEVAHEPTVELVKEEAVDTPAKAPEERYTYRI